MSEFRFTSHGSPLLIAHRGGAVEAEEHGLYENTIPAFRWALDAIGDGQEYFTPAIETDVCATEDGELFVWHGQGAKERSLKNRPLNRSDIDSVRENGERIIPYLTEVLEEFPHTRFLIDPKHEPAVKPLGDILARISIASADRVSVAAFAAGRTQRVYETIFEQTDKTRQICIGLGIGNLALLGTRAVFASHRNWRPRYQTVQLPAALTTSNVIDAAHAGGLRVYPWVVNDLQQMRDLHKKGVDGMMSDKPVLPAQMYREQKPQH